MDNLNLVAKKIFNSIENLSHRTDNIIWPQNIDGTEHESVIVTFNRGVVMDTIEDILREQAAFGNLENPHSGG